MLSTPMTSRRRMPMASSWKLKTTLRRKKSLGSMPSPAFARAGPPPSRGQALEPVNRFAVALAVGVVHGGEQVGRPGQLELDDGHPEAGMTLEDAGEDQIAHRQRRIERLGRAAGGVAQRRLAGPADLALPSRGRVQAEGQVERRGGGPERLVLGLVVAPVLEGILGDHGAGQAEEGGALQ